MNNVTLSGNLTVDPKLIHRGERAICEMRLAVDNGRYDTTYVDVRAFDEQAYACAEYLAKGRKIGVVGRLIYDEWRAEDKTRRFRYSVIGKVEFLDSKPAAGEPQPGEPVAPDAPDPLAGQRELVAA